MDRVARATMGREECCDERTVDARLAVKWTSLGAYTTALLTPSAQFHHRSHTLCR